MKSTRRILSFVLILVMIFADGGIAALAEGVLRMPAALKIIDEEAFYGSTSIDKVTLPEGITEIRSKAFANSTLSEINLPDSLTFIADDAFDGPDKVTITANPGTEAYDWALRNHYIDDALKIKSITANTESANIGDVITWNAVVNGGTNEYSYQYTVYNGKTIVASSSYTEDHSFSYSPTAEGQYSVRVTVDDGENSISKKTDSSVVVSKTALKIISIDASTDSALVGDTVYWTVRTSGGESDLTYSYVLKKDGIQVDAAANYKTNFYTNKIEEKGVYVLTATVKDRSNTSVSSVSEALTVEVQPVQIYSIEFDGSLPVAEGESLTWHVQAIEGTEPYTYIYTIIDNGEECDAIATQDRSYTYNNALGGHTYGLKVVCRDANGDEAEKNSAFVEVFSIEDMMVDVPFVRFPDIGSVALDNEETAPEIASQDIHLEWDSNNDDAEFVITLAKKQNGAWIEISREITNKQTHLIKSSSFESSETAILYRVEFCHNTMWQGISRYYYFYVKPTGTAITINGQTDIVWHQASKYGTNRSFTVESELPWSVSSSEEWAGVLVNEGGFSVSFSTFENNLAFNQKREAVITVTNGENTATVHLTQYEGEAAYIESPIWSQDPANPSIISPGGRDIELDTNPSKTQLLVVYERQNSGAYTEVYRSATGISIVYLHAAETGLFKDNTDYKISVWSVYNKDYRLYEVEDDILTEDYYIRTSANASEIKVNGRTELSMSIVGDLSVSVSASAFYHCTTDAEWLTTNKTEETNTRNGSVKISAEPNYNSSTRVGHVYFHSGTAVATVTVNQESSLPVLIYPAGISENENAPTTIPFGYIRYTAKCEEMQWFVYTNGTYEGITEGAAPREVRIFSSVADMDKLVAGGKYKIVVKSGPYERNYYVNLGAQGVDNIVEIDGSAGTKEWKLPATVFSKTVSVSGEANWTAQSSASWLQLSATSGTTATKNVTITATANTTGAAREATIAFYCAGIDVTHIEVKQIASDDYLEVYVKDSSHMLTADETLHLVGKSTYIDLRPFSSADWSISSNVSWIRFNTSGSSNFKRSSDSISGVASGHQVRVVLSENAYGNNARSGYVTITCGNSVHTFQVSQEAALIEPTFTSPSLSTSSNSPSVYVHGSGNIAISWDRIQNASKYDITIEGISVYDIVGHIEQNETGQSSYNAVIRQEWLAPGETYEVIFEVSNAYGHYKTKYYYLKMQIGAGAYINGTDRPVWNGACDAGETNSFTVRSTENWTAISNNNWLHIDKSSGADGEILQVQADNNPGAARTGTVTITVSGHTTILTVNQNAYLSKQYPEIKTPAYSGSITDPTVIANTSTLRVTWDAEPQAKYYSVTIAKADTDRKTWSLVAKSKTLDNTVGEYTFNNLSLDVGLIYSIELHRNSVRWHNTSRRYYFVLQDDNAAVKIDGNDAVISEFDWEENSTYYSITSSGTWVASTECDWLMVYKRSVDQEDLTNDGDTTLDYAIHRGASGDRLCVSMLQNNGNTRTGTVKVTVGSATAIITITQEGYYVLPEIVSPALTRTGDVIELPYNDITLSWTEGEANTGVYSITLFAKEGRNYTRVYKQSNITERSYTIPKSKLQENTEYRIWLDTILEENGNEGGRVYYFKTSAANALSLSATVDWSQNYIGGMVIINANGNGGSGDYRYEYRLLLDGEVEVLSDSGIKQGYYTFTLTKAGNYQVEITLWDVKTNKVVKNTYNATSVVTADQKAEISIDQTNWTADAVGAGMTINVTANMEWECRGSENWITVTKRSDTQGYVSVSANNTNANRYGRAIFNIGGVGVSMEIVQEPVSTAQDSTLKLTPAVWSVAGYSAEQTSVLVSSSGDWTITSYPNWVIPSATSGKRGDRVSFYAKPNDKEEPRQDDVIFACGNVTKTFTVTQSALDLQPHIDSVDFSETVVPTGKNVEMIVKVRNAAEVQLWADGNLLTENSVAVIGNTATVVRAFSLAGERRIQLRAVREDGVGVFSDEYIITVTSSGELTAPIITVCDNVFVGTDSVVHWSTSDKATNCTLILSLNGNEITRWSSISGTSQLIEGRYLSKAGNYVILVIATAEGYSQSEGSAVLHVIEPVEDFAITFPTNGAPFETHDQIIYKISNPSQKFIRVRITNGSDTWYLPENGVTNAVMPELTFIPLTAGTYRSCILSYIDDSIITPDNNWNKNPTIITYNVSAGTIDSVSVGSNEKSQARQSVGGMTIRGKMGMQTITITESGVASPIAVLDAANHSTVDSRNYRRVFHYKPTGITEGHHVYSFTSVDADNVTSTKTFDLFAYTGYETPFVRYPANKQVHLLEKPTDSTSSGEILALSDRLNVLGHYSNNLYYVQVDKDAEKTGYVLISQTNEKEVIDWSTYDLDFISWSSFGDSGAFPITSSPYSITVNWSLNKPLPEGTGYSVSLIDDEGNYYVISPSEPLKGSSYTFSSTKLKPIIGNSEVGIGVKVQISLYDVVTGRTLLQCVSPEDSWRFIRAQSFETFAKEWVKLGMQACILYHDNTYRCTYQIGDKIYNADPLTTMAYAADRITMLYSFGTGDGTSTTLTKDKRSMLLASSIMNNVASNKASNPVDLESLKTLLSICGFGADYVIAFEESIRDSFGDVTQINMNYAPQKLQNALGELSAAKDLKTVVKTASTTAEVIKMITGVFTDYVNFSKVTRSDVEVYINAFMQSDDPTLQATATNLKCMTSGDLILGAYLGSVYGFDYAEKLVTKQFPDIIALIPGMKGYKLVASGVKLGADLSMNASKVFKARHELLAISAQVDKIRDDFVDSFNRFYDEPVTYYNEFVQAKELLLKMLPLEFEKYNAVVNALNDGKVNKAVYAIGECLGNWPQDRTIHTEDYIEWIRSYIDTALDFYYTQYIEHFR